MFAWIFSEVKFCNDVGMGAAHGCKYLPPVFTPCIYPLIVYNISVKTTLDETNNRE